MIDLDKFYHDELPRIKKPHDAYGWSKNDLLRVIQAFEQCYVSLEAQQLNNTINMMENKDLTKLIDHYLKQSIPKT